MVCVSQAWWGSEEEEWASWILQGQASHILTVWWRDGYGTNQIVKRLRILVPDGRTWQREGGSFSHAPGIASIWLGFVNIVQRRMQHTAILH